MRHGYRSRGIDWLKLSAQLSEVGDLAFRGCAVVSVGARSECSLADVVLTAYGRGANTPSMGTSVVGAASRSGWRTICEERIAPGNPTDNHMCCHLQRERPPGPKDAGDSGMVFFLTWDFVLARLQFQTTRVIEPRVSVVHEAE